MSEFYVTNRDVIKNFSFNTGTSQAPTFTALCTASELSLNTDFNEKTWFVYCDAIQRALKTGVALTIDGTIKLDINNAAIIKVLGDLKSLIKTGAISQFNNQLVQFELLTGVSSSVLTYTKLQATVSYSLESLGGAAEDEASFSISMTINGTGTEVSA